MSSEPTTCPKCGSISVNAVPYRFTCGSQFERVNGQDTGNFLPSKDCEIAELRQQLAEVEGERDRLLEPFTETDPEIEVYQPEGRKFFCYRIAGVDVRPFRTWREAYRAGECYQTHRRADKLAKAVDEFRRRQDKWHKVEMFAALTAYQQQAKEGKASE